jgi:hypothetical protein
MAARLASSFFISVEDVSNAYVLIPVSLSKYPIGQLLIEIDHKIRLRYKRFACSDEGKNCSKSHRTITPLTLYSEFKPKSKCSDR